MNAAKRSAGIINPRRNHDIVQWITALDGLRTVEDQMIVNTTLPASSRDKADTRRSDAEQYDCAWLWDRRK